jgi:hypothetical protein
VHIIWIVVSRYSDLNQKLTTLSVVLNSTQENLKIQKLIIVNMKHKIVFFVLCENDENIVLIYLIKILLNYMFEIVIKIKKNINYSHSLRTGKNSHFRCSKKTFFTFRCNFISIIKNSNYPTIQRAFKHIFISISILLCYIINSVCIGDIN